MIVSDDSKTVAGSQLSEHALRESSELTGNLVTVGSGTAV
jgi:hypothetical protein